MIILYMAKSLGRTHRVRKRHKSMKSKNQHKSKNQRKSKNQHKSKNQRKSKNHKNRTNNNQHKKGGYKLNIFDKDYIVNLNSANAAGRHSGGHSGRHSGGHSGASQRRCNNGVLIPQTRPPPPPPPAQSCNKHDTYLKNKFCSEANIDDYVDTARRKYKNIPDDTRERSKGEPSNFYKNGYWTLTKDCKRAQKKAKKAQEQAERAQKKAKRAQEQAERAQEQAERAQEQSERAQEQAERAQEQAHSATTTESGLQKSIDLFSNTRVPPQMSDADEPPPSHHAPREHTSQQYTYI
jgi:hypothetical protein